MNPLLTLEFYDKGNRAIINENNQRRVTTFSMDNLRNVLSKSSVVCPIFPFWVSGWANREGTIMLISTHSFMFLPVHYGRETYQMHYPFLHFVHALRQEGSGYTHISIALRASFEAPGKDVLTYVPKLPNVDPGSGAMCYGGNNFQTRYNDLSEVRNVDLVFINGVHNDHIQGFNSIARYADRLFQTHGEWRDAMVHQRATVFTNLLGTR